MKTKLTRLPLDKYSAIIPSKWMNLKTHYSLANHAVGKDFHPIFFSGNCLFSTAVTHARNLIKWGEYLSIDILTYIHEIDKAITIANVAVKDDVVLYTIPDILWEPLISTDYRKLSYLSEEDLDKFFAFKEKIGDMPVEGSEETYFAPNDITDSPIECCSTITVNITRI